MSRSAPLLMVVSCLSYSIVFATVDAQATSAPVSEIYTCVDAKGRKLTSDRPIIECNDREQKMLNPSGTVKAKIGPSLTAQERLLLEIKTKAEQDERASKEEEKRRDRALISRYPSLAVHQKERADALAQINLVKQAATARAKELQADLVKLTDELALYAQNPSKAPPKLQRQIDEATQTLAAQQRFLGDQDLELKRINTRFDEELLRLTTLWRIAAGSDPVTKAP